VAVFTAALDLALPFTDNYSTKRPIFNYFDVQVHTSHSHVGVLAVAVWLVATRSLLIYQQPQDPEENSWWAFSCYQRESTRKLL